MGGPYFSTSSVFNGMVGSKKEVEVIGRRQGEEGGAGGVSANMTSVDFTSFYFCMPGEIYRRLLLCPLPYA